MSAAHFAAASLTLRVDGSRVRASVPAPELSRLPSPHAWLRGAWNHLGQAISVIDLLPLYGRPPLHRASWLILLEGTRGPIGILATSPVQVGDGPDPSALRLDADELCARLDTLVHGGRPWT